MHTNIAAHTLPGSNYPAFLSVNYKPETGDVEFIVRSSVKEDGRCGDTVAMTMSARAFRELARHINAFNDKANDPLYRVIEEYKHERGNVQAKMVAAGYDWNNLTLWARLSNRLWFLKHAVHNVLVGLRETTKNTDVFRTYTLA